MTSVEENQTDPEAPYGWTMDPKTKTLRPKRSPGRPRVHQVADEADPEAHLAALRSLQKTRRDGFRERNPTYGKDNAAVFRAEHPEKIQEYQQRYRVKLKREVIDAYGGHCACCGETELVFLTIDHIDDNGAEHRRELAAACGADGSKWGQAGAPTYRWLRDNDFPPGFQVLCANCNCGKQWNGGVCPHAQMADELFGL